MSKPIAILVEDMYQVLEVWYPVLRLKEDGIETKLIRGRKVTCFFAIKDDLKAAGGNYMDQEVVVDKNIITSRKPEDLTAFVKEIINKVKGDR